VSADPHRPDFAARQGKVLFAGLERRGDVVGVHNRWTAANRLSNGVAVAAAGATEFE
jgi:hypothetical protein